jgi:hypothetical protein
MTKRHGLFSASQAYSRNDKNALHRTVLLAWAFWIVEFHMLFIIFRLLHRFARNDGEKLLLR